MNITNDTLKSKALTIFVISGMLLSSFGYWHSNHYAIYSAKTAGKDYLTKYKEDTSRHTRIVATIQKGKDVFIIKNGCKK